MAFGYYGGYQPGYYAPPVPDQLAQLRQGYAQPIQQPIPQPASNGIIWVQGEEGAKGYLVSAGNSVLLMDSENSAFYIKSTDASGMPLPLRVFDYTERTAAKMGAQAPQTPGVDYVTRGEFEALQDKINTFLASSTTNTRKKKGETDDGEPSV